MITYDWIVNHPHVANHLIGMSLAEFGELFAAFELAYMEHRSRSQATRRHKLQRHRAVGAGRKHKYTLPDRLLMTLFWLRAHPTYEVLGLIYDLDKTTVGDNLTDVLDTLSRMTAFHFELPPPEVPKLTSLQEVVDVFPEVRLLIHARKTSHD